MGRVDGFAQLADAPDENLLARVLGRPVGTRPPLGQLLVLEPQTLVQCGLTCEEAEKIVAVAEIARRHQPADGKLALTDPRAAVAQLSSVRQSRSPRMEALLLGRDGHLRGSQVLAVAVEGCARLSALRTAQLVARSGAPAVIIAHNHVDGPVTPTAEDAAFTRELYEACQSAGVELVDHLIVAVRSWLSLREARLLEL